MATGPKLDYLTYPLIQKGSKGADVTFAQKQLFLYMPSEAYTLSINGTYGDDTVAVMKLFQKKCGLTADGVCGPDTWKRLGPQVNNALINHFTGFKAKSIEEVQRLLKLGYRYTGDLDGLWGPMTENGVKSFQKAYGLTQDGIWGRQCWGISEQNYS